jgi:hypothetical protein
MIIKSSETGSPVNLKSYPAATSANDTSWREWLARNRADEIRGAERHIIVIKWISIAVLLAVVALWAVVGPYQRALMFGIALGAFAVMVNAFHAHRYVLAAVFGAIVLLYNPLFPTFSLSGGWQRLIVLASTAPFLASLAWYKPVTSEPVRAQHAQ